MHPVLRCPAAPPPSPSGSSMPRPGATLRAGHADPARSGCAFAEAAGFEPAPGRHAFLPGPTARSRACCSGRRTRAARGDPFLAGKLAGVLAAAAPIGSPTRPMTRGLPRSPLRSAPTGSCATASRRTEVRLELPDGVDGADLSRIARSGLSRARSHQHAGKRHGAGRACGCAAALAGRHGASVAHHRRRRSAGTEFSADPRGRPRRRAARPA